MNHVNFESLTPRQQHVMVLAMQVRNAMEDFHTAHLSDAQMAELNPIIRQALFDAVTFVETDAPDRNAHLAWLVAMIPDYWEVPQASTSPREGMLVQADTTQEAA